MKGRIMTFCEFCFKSLPASSAWTVCTRCDQAMKLQYQVEDDNKARAHAAKYSCIECGEGLPLSRRLKCNTCEPPHARDTESQWDAADSYDIDDTTAEASPMKAAPSAFVPATEKRCNICRATKSIMLFPRDCYTRDTYANRCKACDNARRIERHARKRLERQNDLR